MSDDPFVVLGVDEDAGDEAIKARYLALVREYSPERDPERFQQVRKAYEAVKDERQRIAARLFGAADSALFRLKRDCLKPGARIPARASAAAVRAVLLEGIGRAAGDGRGKGG